jgi:hypothetical protein
VAARLARQCLFSRDSRARFTFYVHEFVLRTPVGGPAVMFDQLHHLLRMSMSSYVTLRVVPASLGVHAAMAGSFTFMEFAEFRPVTYLESPTSSLFLERPEETAAYRSILGALAETSLGEGESRELVATLATELYADRLDTAPPPVSDYAVSLVVRGLLLVRLLGLLALLRHGSSFPPSQPIIDEVNLPLTPGLSS